LERNLGEPLSTQAPVERGVSRNGLGESHTAFKSENLYFLKIIFKINILK
jgi:hypothetical protein